jgi:hypothetical protein
MKESKKEVSAKTKDSIEGEDKRPLFCWLGFSAYCSVFCCTKVVQPNTM